MNKVEIAVAANGYLVRPPLDFNRGEMISVSDIHVFSSFENLVDWLEVKLATPSEHSGAADSEKKGQ